MAFLFIYFLPDVMELQSNAFTWKETALNALPLHLSQGLILSLQQQNTRKLLKIKSHRTWLRVGWISKLEQKLIQKALQIWMLLRLKLMNPSKTSSCQKIPLQLPLLQIQRSLYWPSSSSLAEAHSSSSESSFCLLKVQVILQRLRPLGAQPEWSEDEWWSCMGECVRLSACVALRNVCTYFLTCHSKWDLLFVWRTGDNKAVLIVRQSSGLWWRTSTSFF